MNKFSKPRVVVSKCLEFEACRYSGDLITDQTVKSLEPFVEFIPVCPEVEIGLGVPRETIRLVSGNEEPRLMQPSNEIDLTERMERFSRNFLSNLGEIDGFILKSRSPSCGVRDVPLYKSTKKGSMKDGKTSGHFARRVANYFPEKAIEEEGRLRNFTIREHFFIKLFTLAEFREIKEAPTIQKIIAFHSKHKYLFMAYNQTKLKELGRITANHKQFQIEEVAKAYEEGLYQLFKRAARYTSNINVCEHIMGYFSKSLRIEEKAYFLEMLEQYRNKKLPLSSLTGVLKSWIIRFDDDYLMQQSFFQPYPKELIAISDSGKGRDYA
ncbi:DUF523 and DUF1722 domain-containing protein [Bacillus tianshenii]|nr:DUF523 and DUF1722 domain-containing protein [Bacillus tianshenii]